MDFRSLQPANTHPAPWDICASLGGVSKLHKAPPDSPRQLLELSSLPTAYSAAAGSISVWEVVPMLYALEAMLLLAESRPSPVPSLIRQRKLFS